MALDSLVVKVKIEDVNGLSDKLENSGEIEEENIDKWKKFCNADNYEGMLEIAKKKNIKDFKWPTRGVNLKMLSRRVNEYLSEHEMTDKNDEKGLMEVMTERSWG